MSACSSSTTRPPWSSRLSRALPSRSKPCAAVWPTRTSKSRTSSRRSGNSKASQEGARQKVLRLLGELSALRNELAKIEEFLAGNERQASRTKQEQASAEAELAELGETRLRLEQQVEAHQKELDNLGQRAMSWTPPSASSSSRRRRGAPTPSGCKRKSPSSAPAAIRSKRSFRTTPTPPKRSRTCSRPLARRRWRASKPVGILADFVEVDPKFERATEEFLREELEYVVVHSWQEARQGIHLLRSEMQGFATFLVHPEAPVAEETPALGPETGVVGRLAEKIQPDQRPFGLGFDGVAAAAKLLPGRRRRNSAAAGAAISRLPLPAAQRRLLSRLHRQRRQEVGGRSAGVEARAARAAAARFKISSSRSRRPPAEAAQAEEQIAARTSEMEAVRAQLQSLEKAALAAEHELRESKNHVEKAERRLSVARLEMERLTPRAGNGPPQESEQKRAAVDQRERERVEAEEALTALRQTARRGPAPARPTCRRADRPAHRAGDSRGAPQGGQRIAGAGAPGRRGAPAAAAAHSGADPAVG